ncbi:Oligoxyloglucan reducing end-specific cellobiohydrolase [Peniophora sp. CONT]|nr:Oligoxyloglucan reducing end-specific cellobiohydrolase [Peniophora sp. CONT]
MARARASWLALAPFLVALVYVQAQEPAVTLTHFRNLPAALISLDDTTMAISHDAIEGNIYVSQDEGKDWDRANDIPEGQALVFIEHPSFNRMAFALTKGTTHYLTEDRGKTWRPFKVPIPPAFVTRPLSFHSDKDRFGYILYQGTNCERQGWGTVCHDETYYTTNAFGDVKLLLLDTSLCQFAHSSVDFKHDAHPNLIYCVAFDTSSTSGHHSLSSSRLFSSTDFFEKENKVEDLGIGHNARGVIALTIVSKFAVVALEDVSGAGDVLLYTSVDTVNWAKAQLPQASSARLRENGYTITEGTTHSLAIDVLHREQGAVSTLFVSDINGTFFVESLRDTDRNEMGFVNFETLVGVEGVGIVNVVANAQDVEGRGASRKLKSMITYDGRSSWSTLRAPRPSTDSEGKRIGCDPADTDVCALHLHSVTLPHNFGRVFSSTAPGLVMGVGSVGKYLKPYDECDTFLSTDAGITWKMVRRGAHIYEFGDKGSVIVAVNDEAPTDAVRYSTDMGKTWKSAKLPTTLRARALTTVPDSTSQKFMLLGQLGRGEAGADSGRYVIAHLDFAPVRGRQCGEADFEKWYARSQHHECLMGRRQWYNRRKPNADCYVENKFEDLVKHGDNCPCVDSDFECDYNFVRDNDQCVLVGPEPIPAGVCPDKNGKYMGSSGYRLIPGNTCDRNRGKKKDEKKEKSCSQATPETGSVVHQTFDFPSRIVQHSYFQKATTILVRLDNGDIYLSQNEGYTWNQIEAGNRFLAFYHHSFTPDRAYLITAGKDYYYTTNTGGNWYKLLAPTPPNTFGVPLLHFHPEKSDYLIWVGNEGCGGMQEDCRAVAHYSHNNGRIWTKVEDYVRHCAWAAARASAFRVDPSEIICESYRDKKGNQRFFNPIFYPLELWTGQSFYKDKHRLFEDVVGFAKSSAPEYFIVEEYQPEHGTLDLQVSLDGLRFSPAQFPPSMHPVPRHAHTLLESSTDSIFLYMTTQEPPGPAWGTILKSNSNGTYFGVSVQNVNRDERGYVDFEKMIGLDGIALINVVVNPDTARVERKKTLQTRISHNDGGSWKALQPPLLDSQGNAYPCNYVGCTLNFHGYTERYDPRATFSTPSVVGLIMAVGSVGEQLAPYTESDTFLSRDAGFTWEEVHKDAHLWEFGDSGSVLVMVNDEGPTDTVLYSTNEGLEWQEYRFATDEKVRVRSIVTAPSGTSRRFLLLGERSGSKGTTAVHLDFSAITTQQCVVDIDDPGNDDFELWSPSEERAERCLFGRQTLYHRRKRDRNCVVGAQPKAKEINVKTCSCHNNDFECEFNHERDEDGKCVLIPGRSPLPDDTTCHADTDSWFERTAYRRIPHSSCDGGVRLDRGKEHACPANPRGLGLFFWLSMLMLLLVILALGATWWYRSSGRATGRIRLPDEDDATPRGSTSDTSLIGKLASIPRYISGMVGRAWEKVADTANAWMGRFRRRTGPEYQNVPVEADA